MTLRASSFFVLTLGLGLCAAGCSADAGTDDETNDELGAADQQEYSFRYEFPTKDLFKDAFTKSFPLEIEKKGVRLQAIITPTAKIDLSSPVIEGLATIGEHRILSAVGISLPKILDAELKATTKYKAELDVDLDLRWNTTEQKDVMREIARDIEMKLSPGRAVTFLASNLGETNIPLTNKYGIPRKDLPLKTHIDVAVSCSFDEIDGDMQGTLRTGVNGTVVARAVYNSDGVEKRAFKRDPKKKFELDTNDVKIDPSPSFEFKAFRQHVKGECSVQPVIVVSFDNGVGVRLRIDGSSTFDTQVKVDAVEATAGWELRATPSIGIYGETDIKLPILHHSLDKETELFAKDFPEVRVDIGDAQRAQ
jgi:hypothetical protein